MRKLFGAQKDMLEDHKRTGAYYQAVMQNRRQFEGKVVLDVGTGSGILALFAAKAGARKVYAVEATSMAKFAKELVTHNDVSRLLDCWLCQTLRIKPTAVISVLFCREAGDYFPNVLRPECKHSFARWGAM